MKTRTVIRTLVLVALMLNLGVAGAYAQHKPVKMTFSGSLVATTINLQDGTITDEENVAGDGTLGPFTYRELHADLTAPQPSSTCPLPLIFVPTVRGGGVFRFEDGSLLTVNVADGGGGICIDFAKGVARLTLTYEITGGTKRLKGASGTLTVTTTVMPVLFSASGAAELLTITGKFEGTVLGVAIEDRDERR
jgi:hypothetical protein